MMIRCKFFMRLSTPFLIPGLALLFTPSNVGAMPLRDGEPANHFRVIPPHDVVLEPDVTVPFTGQDVFRGIFFGAGPVATILPEIWGNPPADPPGPLHPATAGEEMIAAASDLEAAGREADAQIARRVGELLIANSGSLDSTPRLHGDDQAREAMLLAVNLADSTFFARFGAAMQSGDHLAVADAISEGATKLLDARDAVYAGLPLGVPGAPMDLVAIDCWIYGYIAVAVAVVAVLVLVVGIVSGGGGDVLQYEVLIDLLANRLEATPAVWVDTFDSYPVGGLAGQGGWQGWDGNPAADASVTDALRRSVPNAVAMLATSDLVRTYAGIDSGQWSMAARCFVPAGAVGQQYFILLNDYQNGGPYAWSTQVAFDADAGEVRDFDGDGVLPLIRDQWVEIRVDVDLDADTQSVYYNGQQLFSDSWSGHVQEPGVTSIAALDLYSDAASTIYWDDLLLTGEPSSPTAVGDLPASAPTLSAHPNPFNPRTEIHFRLEETKQVSLAVYDLRGREVRSLISGVAAAGDHAVLWDGLDGNGRPQSTGTYLVRLRVPGGAQMTKVSLVR